MADVVQGARRPSAPSMVIGTLALVLAGAVLLRQVAGLRIDLHVVQAVLLVALGAGWIARSLVRARAQRTAGGRAGASRLE